MTREQIRNGKPQDVARHLDSAPTPYGLDLQAALVNALARIATLEAQLAKFGGKPACTGPRMTVASLADSDIHDD